MEKLRVDIWSDVMCPFCYIGKRNFESALKQFPYAANITVKWHSFQLDPDLVAVPGETVFDYLARRKGISAEQSQAMHEHVAQMAASAGLTYDFSRMVVANSNRAHRLIQIAKKYDRDDQVEELLFRAYFTEGKDIDDTTVLADIARQAGLPEADLENNSAEWSETLSEDLSLARQIGINGVPFFLFDWKYAVSGAQPPATFLEVLNTAFMQWQKNNPDAILLSATGESCESSGDCT